MPINNAAMDAEKQRLIAIYTKLNLDAGMAPDVATMLAHQRAQREAFGGAYPKSPQDTLTDLLQETNIGNESRYGQALGIANQSKNDQVGAVESAYGSIFKNLDAGVAEAHERENMTTGRELGGMQADLSSRGLNNTTIKDTMKQNVLDRSSLRNREIDADNAQRLIGVNMNYAGAKTGAIRAGDNARIGVIESRTDAPPDLGLYASMLAQPGAAGGFTVGGSHHAPSMFGGFTQGGQSIFTSPLRAPGSVRPSAYANLYSSVSGTGTAGGSRAGALGTNYVATNMEPPSNLPPLDWSQIGRPLPSVTGDQMATRRRRPLAYA